MRTGQIVQFVSFDTSLDSDQFISQWEKINSTAHHNIKVILQQSEKNGKFRYLAQHCSASGEFQFAFTKSGRSQRSPEVDIKAKQAGGYSILQLEKNPELLSGDSKVFGFILSPQVDLNSFRILSTQGKLNIYEAYYENSQYAYILEYFVPKKYVDELTEQLKLQEAVEVRTYKECDLQVV